LLNLSMDHAFFKPCKLVINGSISKLALVEIVGRESITAIVKSKKEYTALMIYSKQNTAHGTS